MKAIRPAAIIDGILLLNKSEGMTSNSALQKAKRLLGAKKAGHTGSLVSFYLMRTNVIKLLGS
jgi:tRNA pseudouridine55 synthase